MADIQLLLEAERRGLLPKDKIDLLNEARSRGLIEGQTPPKVEQPQVEPPKESSFARRAFGDTAAGLAQGVVGLGEAAVGLADIPTFGATGKLANWAENAVFGGNTQDARAYLQSLKSPEEQAAEKNVSDAKGFMPTVSALASNPTALLNTVLESAPSMVGGAGIARKILSTGEKMLAKKLGLSLEEFAAKKALESGVAGAGEAATQKAILAGATGEGAISAGSTAESIRQQNKSGYLSPEQVAISAVSGALTGSLGVFGGKLAQKLGIGDIDTLLAGGTRSAAQNEAKKSLILSATKGALAESAFEELPQSMQEQISQNIATGKPWDEGVAEAGAQGAMAAIAMGGVGGAMSQASSNRQVQDRLDREDIQAQRAINELKTKDITPEQRATAEAEILAKAKEAKDAAKASKKASKIKPDELDSLMADEIVFGGTQNAGVDTGADGTSTEISGGLDTTGDTGGIDEPIGAGVDGAGSSTGQLKTGTEAQPTTLNTILDTNGVPFKSNGKAQAVRRTNGLNETHAIVGDKKSGWKIVPRTPAVTPVAETPVSTFNEAELQDEAPIATKQSGAEVASEAKKLSASLRAQLNEQAPIEQAPIAETAINTQSLIDARIAEEARVKKEEADTNAKLTAERKAASIEQQRLEQEQAQPEADRRQAAMDQAEQDRVERTYPFLSTLDKADATEDVKAGYEANRGSQDEQLGKRLGNESELPLVDLKTNKLPTWSELTQTEKSLYTTINDVSGPDEAIKAVRNFRTAAPDAPANAAIYELNRKTASKEHKIEFPEWHRLSKEAKDNFLTKLPALDKITPIHSGKKLHTAFENVASQLETENVAFRNIADVDVARVKHNIQEETSLQQSQVEIELTQAIRENTALLVRPITGKDGTVTGIKTLGDILSIIKRNREDTPAGEVSVVNSADIIAEKLTSIIGKLGKDVIIKFGTIANGNPAQFDPATNTITIDETNLAAQGRRIDGIVIHEAVHYALDHIIDNPRQQTYAQRKAVNELKAMYESIKHIQTGWKKEGGEGYGTFAEAYEIGSFKEFLAEVMSNANLQRELAKIPVVKPNEGSKKGSKWTDLAQTESGRHKQELFNQIAKFGDVFSAFVERVAGVLGFRSEDAQVLKSIISQLDSIISDPKYTLPTKARRGKSISYAPSGTPRTPAPVAATKTADEVTKENIVEPDSPKQTLKYIWHGITNPRKGYRALEKRFQSISAPLKRWQRDMDLAHKTIRGVNNAFNNVYELLSGAASKARRLYAEHIWEHEKVLHTALRDLAKSSNKSVTNVLAELHTYLTGLHEPERRRWLFIKNVPLDYRTKITINGVTDTPANFKVRILDRLNSLKDIPNGETIDQQAVRLRKVLDSIVFTDIGNLTSNDNALRKGTLNTAHIDKAFLGKEELNENSDKYMAEGGINPETIDNIRNKLDADPNKPSVMGIMNIVKDIGEATITLNKIGNYMSPPVQARIAFMGFENYVPFKGNPHLADERQDSLFGSKDDNLSSDFQHFQATTQGRKSKSQNPLIQVMVDAEKSAFIAAHNEVSQATSNAIKQGHIETEDKKGPKIIPFADRYTALTKQELGKRNTIFNYLPDGSIEVHTIKNTEILESLRQPYKQYGSFGKAFYGGAGWLTRFIGQGFTRFNPAFSIWNAMRDTLTNLYNITIDEGFTVAGKYIVNVTKYGIVDTLAGGGVWKSGKAMKLFKANNFTELQRLARNDEFYKNFIEYANHGGVVTYLQGVSNTSKLNEISKELNKGITTAGIEQVTNVFDFWFDMFETTVRVASYKTVKDSLTATGVNDEEAQIQASIYTKNLANFEQSGKYGKEMGSLYMFSRAQATGAVRAIDSLSYGLHGSLEKALAELPASIENDPAAKATYIKEYTTRRNRSRIISGALVGMGMAAYVMALGASDDDEQGLNEIAHDDMSRWTRAMRFTIPGTDYVFQIPWGFGMGSFGAWGAQMVSYGMGHQSTGDFVGNAVTIGLDSFIPIPVSRIPFAQDPRTTGMAILDTAMPSVLRPYTEYLMNKNGLGQDIVNLNNKGKTPDAFASRGNVPEVYKEAAEWLFKNSDGDTNVSPNLLYFFATSYANGFALFTQSATNLDMVIGGDKEFSAKADSVFIGSFLSTKSDWYSQEFNRIEQEIKQKEQKIDGFKTMGEYNEYFDRHPNDQLLVDSYNKDTQKQLKKLREQRHEIIGNRDIPTKVRDEMLKENKLYQQYTKADLISKYKYIDEELKTRQDD